MGFRACANFSTFIRIGRGLFKNNDQVIKYAGSSKLQPLGGPHGLILQLLGGTKLERAK